MRPRLIPLFVCVLLVGSLAAVALGQIRSPSPARAAAVRATGAFEISNSVDGQPIFAAGRLAPGGSARGEVTIEDSGSVPVALKLGRGEISDTPGIGGGVLSGRLRLTVADVTDRARSRTLYAGPLDSMPEQEAGELKPGASRTYEFTATLPDGLPSNQNALQQASTTIAYSWNATEVTGGEGGLPSDVPRGGGSENPGTPAGGGAPPAATRLDLNVPKILSTPSGGSLLTHVRCNASCRIVVRGTLRGVAHGHHRAARISFSPKRPYTPGAKKMRIPVPRGIRDWLRRMPPPKRLRGRLRFTATGTAGGRDVVTKTVRLRVRH